MWWKDFPINFYVFEICHLNQTHAKWLIVVLAIWCVRKRLETARASIEVMTAEFSLVSETLPTWVPTKNVCSERARAKAGLLGQTGQATVGTCFLPLTMEVVFAGILHLQAGHPQLPKLQRQLPKPQRKSRSSARFYNKSLTLSARTPEAATSTAKVAPPGTSSVRVWGVCARSKRLQRVKSKEFFIRVLHQAALGGQR